MVFLRVMAVPKLMCSDALAFDVLDNGTLLNIEDPMGAS